MSSKPVRIQRRRTKGWRMPEGAVYVGRPTKYGNKFAVGRHYKRHVGAGIPRLGLSFIYLEAFEGYQDASFTTITSRAEAVEWFRWYLAQTPTSTAALCAELRGKDLACWCPLDQPCHADVLLELANADQPRETTEAP